MRLKPVLFFRTCAKKKAAHERRPESREETPKKASATSLLHCNNDLGINFVQQERQIFCLPLFFADMRDSGASLSTALPSPPAPPRPSAASRSRISPGSCSRACLLLFSFLGPVASGKRVSSGLAHPQTGQVVGL